MGTRNPLVTNRYHSDADEQTESEGDNFIHLAS